MEWNALTSGFVKSLKELGLPSQARDLFALSAASVVRVAAHTPNNILSVNTHNLCI